MPDPTMPDWLPRYLERRDRERAKCRDAAFARLTERERRLCREFAVMGFVQGVMHAGGLHSTPVPRDTETLSRTLDGLLSMPDTYPVFAALTSPVQEARDE